jgi:hypothetical protein
MAALLSLGEPDPSRGGPRPAPVVTVDGTTGGKGRYDRHPKGPIRPSTASTEPRSGTARAPAEARTQGASAFAETVIVSRPSGVVKDRSYRHPNAGNRPMTTRSYPAIVEVVDDAR